MVKSIERAPGIPSTLLLKWFGQLPKALVAILSAMEIKLKILNHGDRDAKSELIGQQSDQFLTKIIGKIYFFQKKNDLILVRF